MWIKNRCNVDVELNIKTVLCIMNNERENSVVRYLYAHCLKYIFCNKIQKRWPNFTGFLSDLKMLERVEFEIDCRNGKVTRHHLKWGNISQLKK